MGFWVPIPIFGLSLIIDGGTILFHKATRRKEISDNPKVPNFDVNVIIPVYNEERMIKPCVESIFNQTQPPKYVIVVDDCSQDKTQEFCKQLQQKYSNLVYIRMPQNHGKAHNINYIVQRINDEFSSKLTLLVDADVMLMKDFIEQIKKPFINENVAAVSGAAIVFKEDPMEPESFMTKIITSTYNFLFNFYSFRKTAQSLRKAVTPVCGGCVAFRTEILKKIPIPERTITEDTDYTWVLYENGYDVIHYTKSKAYGEESKTLKGFFNQWFRWYSGTIQCLYVHNKKLLKAKRLFFSTIIPSQIDAWIYIPFLLLILPLLFLWPQLVFLGLLFDFFLTAIVMLILSRRELKHLPFIWLMRFPIALAWIAASFKVTWEWITSKQHTWSSRWERQSNL